MKKVIVWIALALSIVTLVLSATGCAQEMTKSLGGTTTLELEPNQKLEMITWKESDLWYLTKPMTDDDVAETHTFKQSSNTGIFEGMVIIIETKE